MFTLSLSPRALAETQVDSPPVYRNTVQRPYLGSYSSYFGDDIRLLQAATPATVELGRHQRTIRLNAPARKLGFACSARQDLPLD